MQTFLVVALFTSLSAPLSEPHRTATLDIAVRQQSAGSLRLQSPGVRVWVNLSSKVYHCPGTGYYGVTKRGQFMSEAAAEKTGSRPAYGRRCSGDEIAAVPVARTSPSETFRSSSTPAKHLTSSDSASKVWVNRKSHVYHCPGTRYYGTTKTGEFMLESDAIASGNRPAYGRSCN
jgi:hypothetical protein